MPFLLTCLDPFADYDAGQFALPKPNHKNTNSHGNNSANLDFEADLVDCMVALPGQLFYGTQIPARLSRATAANLRAAPAGLGIEAEVQMVVLE